MFAYSLRMAVHSLKRNRALTALMVLALALGIGACMTTLTVFRILSGDPLPGRSQSLHYVQLDAGSLDGYAPGREPQTLLTRYDAETLLREARADRQALMTAGRVSIQPEHDGLRNFLSNARYASADFFALFDAPLRYGRAWNAGEDAQRARVAVISAQLNDKLFGGADSVGRSLVLDGHGFRIVGVLAPWRPVPKFYDLSGDRFGEPEQVLLPFSTSRDLSLALNGNSVCWGNTGGDPEGRAALNAPCAYLQYWAQLDTPERAQQYRRYLDDYSEQQHGAGRFPRPANVRLRDVNEWLRFNQVVPADVRLQAWLALGFLLACLVNTVGLLLAKFLRRGGEIGLRRALGASRKQICAHCLAEVGVIGLAGGALGLLLTLLGLWLVRQQPERYAQLAELDAGMLAATFALALVASLAAGLLPAWRAMQVAPAIQLKTQ